MTTTTTTKQAADVAVVALPLPLQGHLNPMLLLSGLISSHGLAVHYAGTAVLNRQAKARMNSLSPQGVAGINFIDIPIPPFLSPPTNPDSADKFPSQLEPAVRATSELRLPVADLVRNLAGKFRRIVVIYDPFMANVVQDVGEIKKAELYEFVCISAFASISFFCGFVGKPFPLPHPKELPPFEDWMPKEINQLAMNQQQYSIHKSGNIYSTSRLIEAPYLEVLQQIIGKPAFGVGPLLSSPEKSHHHQCLDWLDKQEPKSVLFVSFGTTVSLSDEQINELANGLHQSKVKFLWVVRDADRCDIFQGEQRKAGLPLGFEEKVKGDGMVVRDWAPQPQILAHRSIGGFMSHCGWNSCMESLTIGVAIAAWPMHSDQPSNAALVADILKTGIVVREWKERAEVVKAARVESVVRKLMASDEGGEMQKRAAELGAALRGATEPGGASRVEMESLIARFTR